MKTKEFYKEAVAIVSQMTEIKEKEMFESNKESCVDARYILVGNLADYFTDEEIVSLTGLARSTANKIRNEYRSKLRKFTFRCTYQEVTEAMKKVAISIWGGGKMLIFNILEIFK